MGQGTKNYQGGGDPYFDRARIRNLKVLDVLSETGMEMTLQSIMQKTGFGSRTVSYALQSLEDNSLIKVVRQRGHFRYQFKSVFEYP